MVDFVTEDFQQSTLVSFNHHYDRCHIVKPNTTLTAMSNQKMLETVLEGTDISMLSYRNVRSENTDMSHSRAQ